MLFRKGASSLVVSYVDGSDRRVHKKQIWNLNEEIEPLELTTTPLQQIDYIDD